MQLQIPKQLKLSNYKYIGLFKNQIYRFIQKSNIYEYLYIFEMSWDSFNILKNHQINNKIIKILIDL